MYRLHQLLGLDLETGAALGNKIVKKEIFTLDLAEMAVVDVCVCWGDTAGARFRCRNLEQNIGRELGLEIDVQDRRESGFDLVSSLFLCKTTIVFFFLFMDRHLLSPIVAKRVQFS